MALILACGALAQYTAVAALQRGGAIETIGLMGLVANATQIAGGVLVFGDPLSPDPLGIVLQAAAFAMVCLSALLMPSRAACPRSRALASAESSSSHIPGVTVRMPASRATAAWRSS